MRVKQSGLRLPRWRGFATSADWAAACVVAIGLTALFVPVTYALIRAGSSDFIIHNDWARELAETGQLATAHFLYHALSVLTQAIIPGIGFSTSGFIVDLAAYVACGLLVYAVQRRAAEGWPATSAIWLSGGAAFGIVLAAPIALFVLADKHLYFGYISPNVYHNPTVTVLKPLALAHFTLTVAALKSRVPSPASTLGLLAGLGMLATLAKPSYSLVVLPAFGLWALVNWREALKQWRLYVLGLGMPIMAVLLLQYAATFTSGESIIFAPLLAMRYRSDWLLPKLLVSIVYPLVVYGAYFQAARRDVGLNLAWLAFFAGLVLVYLFAETGERQSHLNFVWSSQVILFILLCLSTALVFRQEQPDPAAPEGPRLSRRGRICAAVFGLHVIAGVVWFGIHLGGQPLSWW